MTHAIHPTAPEWRISNAPVPYRAALAEQEARNTAIAAGEARELIWLLEHPPVYTAGTSADPAELVDARFEVVEAGAGGATPTMGRVSGWLTCCSTWARAGAMCAILSTRWKTGVIGGLSDFGVEAWAAEGRIGIWTRDIDGAEAKIGAIGVRVRKWVTMHGLSVNLAPDLAHFGGIVPCGIAEYGVTSLARLGIALAASDWDEALQRRLPGFLAALEVSE